MSCGGCGDHIEWGVTVDNPWPSASVAEALKLPKPMRARIVYDEGQRANDYVQHTRVISDVAHVMGELLDSFYMKSLTVEQYRQRAQEYMRALPQVSTWEIGNEVNGNWLGPNVVEKVAAALDVARTVARSTALTLYWDEDMVGWASRMDKYLRWCIEEVYVSFYEDDHGTAPDWLPVFKALSELFPRAKLGFGECGTRYAPLKEEYMKRWYTTRVPLPRFVGGYYWWYFSEDCVPRGTPLWNTLSDILRAQVSA